MLIALLFIIPILSIALLFVKDTKKIRRSILNVLLLLNLVLYASPVLVAYANTPKGENMFSELSGGGAALWLYYFILPASALVLLILMVLKLIFSRQ